VTNRRYVYCQCCAGAQPRAFKVGGPVPWSRVLLSFYRKKLDRSTQFDAVGYIITLYSSKSYVKSWGSVQILGGPDPPTPSGCAHGAAYRTADARDIGLHTETQTLQFDRSDVEPNGTVRYQVRTAITG